MYNHSYLFYCKVSGRTHNLSNALADGTFVFSPPCNSRSTINSALRRIKSDLRLMGCKIDEVVRIVHYN